MREAGGVAAPTGTIESRLKSANLSRRAIRAWTEAREETSTVVAVTSKPAREAMPSVPGDYLAYYRALAKAVGGDGPNPVTAEEAPGVIEILELVMESAREGRRLTPSARPI